MFVIWLTGLPCSGKTTIANELGKRIPNMVVLDGDNLRSWLSQEDFSREGRIRHNKRVATVAKMLADHNVPVSVSLVSPYKENRKDAREIVDSDRFLEVYVKCPLEVCEKRDVKGMYHKAREGKITSFTGIDDPYEEPKTPDVVVDTDAYNVNECVEKIIFKCSKWLKPFVLMTGYQRSGTSFLARAMNLCGVYLGDKIRHNELNPVSYNLRGTWENQDFWDKIHSKVVLGRDRNDYSNLPEDILEPPSLSDTTIIELKKIVSELMDHPSLASGIKGAQSLVAMSIIGYLPANTVIVAIFRHPLRVVDSMLRGRGVPTERWDELRPRFLNLWRASSKALLEILDERLGFLLNFDWPKERMLGEIRAIVNKLGLIETDLTSWYTDELKHSDNYVDANNFPDNESKELYERLLLRAELNDKVVISPSYQPKAALKGVIMDLEAEITALSEAVYKLSSRPLDEPKSERPLDEPKSGISSFVRSVTKKITH